MLDENTKNKLIVHGVVRRATKDKIDAETIAWRVALSYALGCRETYDRGDWAHELLNGLFTMRVAYAMMSEQILEDEAEFVLCWQEEFGS